MQDIPRSFRHIHLCQLLPPVNVILNLIKSTQDGTLFTVKLVLDGGFQHELCNYKSPIVNFRGNVVSQGSLNLLRLYFKAIRTPL